MLLFNILAVVVVYSDIMASEARMYKGEISEIFDLCIKAITSLNWQIASFNHSSCMIKAETNLSLLSWGDDIEIEIQQMRGGINVKINSESRAQLVDWGKNDENIQKFFSVLESLIPSKKE